MSLLYEEVVERLAGFIRRGTYRQGAKLPSIRELAERFSCSRNTVIRAYEELERRNLVFSVAKSGFYLVDNGAGGSELNLEAQENGSNGGIDMASASPDGRMMPFEDFRHCLNRAVELYKNMLFGYGSKEGLLTLRELLVKRLYGDQIFVRAEQVFIVSGVQQALHILAGMPFPNGKTRILLEQPAYTGMIRSASLQGATAIGIARTEQGVNLAELEQHFRCNDIKFFYTTPRFHNPSGASYTMEMKRAIVRLAQAYGVYVLEDDYLGDLDDRPRRDSMAALDSSGWVVHLRSFSKTVLPGIRLGYAVVPHSLAPAMREHKAAADAGSSSLNQGALEIYLKSGMFDRHLKNVRTLYKERMAALREACAGRLPPGIRFHAYDNGIFGMVELPDEIPAAALAARLERLGLSVAPGNHMRLPGQAGCGFIRLSIIRADKEEIERGITILAAELEHARKQHHRRRTIDDPAHA
ncbi:MAG: PLP-dependent aminotransferase family protein [Paenibacillaceae bacterium]|nr:PLP-dependent aminotransferase family protein [Paenibacillaceae bacterium]